MHPIKILVTLATFAAAQREQAPIDSTPHMVEDTPLRNTTWIREQLVEAEVIPTVLDDFVPSYALFVSWKHDKTALLGNTLDPSNLQKAPSVTLQIPKWKENIVDYGREGTHVITLTDPDAPSRDKPKWSEFCHWIGTGVPISHRRGVFDVKIYKDIIEYKPPGPPKGTGKHRYVFTVFLPADGTHELDLTKPKDRKHWGQDKYSGVREWAHENGLIPVAANFVYAQHED